MINNLNLGSWSSGKILGSDQGGTRFESSNQQHVEVGSLQL